MDDLLQLTEKAIIILKEAYSGTTVRLSEKDRKVFSFLRLLQEWANFRFREAEEMTHMKVLWNLELRPYEPKKEFWIQFNKKYQINQRINDEYFKNMDKVVRTEIVPHCLDSCILVLALDKLFIYKDWISSYEFCSSLYHFNRLIHIDPYIYPQYQLPCSNVCDDVYLYKPQSDRQFQKDLLRFQHICMPVEWKSPICILLNVFMIPDLSSIVTGFLHWYSFSSSVLDIKEHRLVVEKLPNC